MRTVTRSYRIRAYPNGAQRRWLDLWLGAARWLWNTALEIRCRSWAHSKSPNRSPRWSGRIR
ncbi:MAG: hypothetical protein E6K41_00305 [Gammaproteobacteria bacterium]|nr:MAG: hypothetical protein E6K41_00305 [Gammaproteobacteria bacterium]